MATTRPHLAPILAVGALSAATALSLTRVFAHTAWLAPVLVAALAPVAIVWCAVKYRWSSRAYALIVFYGAVWWSTLVAYPDRTVLGIVPTPPALALWLHGILNAPHVLRTAVVPVAPIGHALELAIFAIWIATAGAAWSATKHGGVLIAVLPSLGLFIAIASLGKGPYVLTTTLWCAAAGAFLLVQHADAVLRSRTGFQAPAAHRSRLLAGGACAAVIALGFGALVGPRLPEANSAPLLDYRGIGGNGGKEIVDVSPLVGIGDKLRQPKPTNLFTVTATAPARWRLMALDDFDGNYWSLYPEETTTTSLQPDRSALINGAIRTPVIQHYTIGPMSGAFLPAAYHADSGAEHLSSAVVIPGSATLVVPDGNHEGLQYDITSTLVGAQPATLQKAPDVDPSDPTVAKDLELPASMVPRDVALAKQVAGNGNEYEKAIRLQNFFRDPQRFRYDQSINLTESSHAMDDFLFNVRAGFCEQFAGTYAAMARAVGLPTRVAVGFQTGDLTREVEGDGGNSAPLFTYTVSTRHAHAWPEVYFPNVGWITFEPTPGRFDWDSPGDPNGTAKNAPTDPSTSPTAPSGGSTTTVSPTTTSPAGSPNGPRQSRPPSFGIAPPPSGSSPHHSRGSHAYLWLVIPGIMLLALGSIMLAVALVRGLRRWRRVHAPSPRARVGGAWTEATEHLARRDIRRRPAATLVEFALREAPAAGAGAAGPPLLELAQIQTRAMYAVDEPGDDEARRAWQCADAVGAALRAQTPPRERMRQRFGLSAGRRRKRKLRFL